MQLPLDKSRLTLLAHLIASCVTLAACGGGNTGDVTAASAETRDAASESTTVAAATPAATPAAAPAATDSPSTPAPAPAPVAAAVTSTAAATAIATDNVDPSSVEALASRRRREISNSPAPAAVAPTPAPAPATTTVKAAPAPAVTTTAPSSAPAAAPAPATTPAAVASGPQTTASFSSTTMNIVNPERGFYGWSADYFQNMTASSIASMRDSQGIRLTLGLVNLSAYRSSSIPQSFLDTLTAKFALLRANGVKVVLRPVYNYDSSGSDASVAQVKAHLAQLAPLFSANADVIGYFQAGFIGAWGEWHDSASGLTSDANKAAIRDAVLAAVPSQFPVQFRYPYDIMKWFPTALGASQAFDGSTQSRAAVHNDCFMSSDNDVGTYQNNALTNNPQREYTKSITEYGPFGGETCSGFTNPRMSCAQILSEGPAYHLAYLNINFYAAFMNQWKSEGCYDQVTRSMGYRLQLDAVSHPVTAARNSVATFAVDLRNVGWSRIFSPRKLVVTLTNKSTGAVITGTGATDMRTLHSQASTSTRANVSVTIPSGAAAGDYAVSLSMPDIYTTTAGDARFAVRFANADNAGTAQAWNAATGRFDIGTKVTVQ